LAALCAGDNNCGSPGGARSEVVARGSTAAAGSKNAAGTTARDWAEGSDAGDKTASG
jgi:hypothetical protein